MTQKELAQKVKKSQTLITQIINRKSRPSVKTAFLLGEITSPHITDEQWLTATRGSMLKLWKRYQLEYKRQMLRQRHA